MKSLEAVAAIKALANTNRLAIYRRLVQAGEIGLTVGELQADTGHPAATLTNHLNVLRQAGLVSDRRNGRHIWCRADYARMNALLAYLTENCCAGADCGVPGIDCDPTTPSSTRKTSP